MKRDPEIIGESEIETDEGLAILRTTSTDAIPQEAFGFTIECFFAPYPLDAPQSHRRAIYARFSFFRSSSVCGVKRAGHAEILAHAPLSREAVRDIRRDPNCRTAEVAALGVISEGGKLAKIVAEA